MNTEQRISELEKRVNNLEKKAAAGTTARREIWILTQYDGNYVLLGVANSYEAAIAAYREYSNLDICFLVGDVVIKQPRNKEDLKKIVTISNN